MTVDDTVRAAPSNVPTRLRSSAEWRFLGVLPRAGRTLAASWWALVLARGMLPALFALAMGSLVGAVQDRRPLGASLAAVGALFVAINALGPVHGAVGSLLGAKAGAWLHDRLMAATVEPGGIAHLEHPALIDELARAKEFDNGIVAPPLSAALPYVANGFSDITAALAQTVLLATYRWWAGPVLALAWASTHLLLRESAMWKIFYTDEVTLQHRHVDYAYKLAVEAPGAKEIRVFGLSDWAVDRVRDLRSRLSDLIFRERRLRQRPLALGLAIVAVGNAVVLGSLARDASSGELPLRSVVVFAQAAIGISLMAFGDFDWWFRGTAQPIPTVIDLADKMRGAGLVAEGTRPATGLPARSIRFDGVHFAYPTTGVVVLDGFDLEIAAGTSLAIVGPNGAGKTTLAKLLCRFYDPQGGAVLVDGTDLRELDVESWRGRIAAVFQDFVRFELPLRTNVAPSGATDEVVERALARAGASGLAGLGTVLSRGYEGGTDLSGGQWQRVALARVMAAVALGAGVVLLDEPTAQLDVRGEAEIFERILEATRGLTTILVSHRFSTVRHADRICVLEGGRVIELGSHDELMELSGRYRTMFELQASRFYDEEAQEPLEELT